MAEAADIGANFSSYTGNAGLGGGVVEATKIDTSPVQMLAMYQYEYNKLAHQEKVVDTNGKIKELADLTAFDPNSAIEKDKKVALDTYNQLLADGSEYSRKSPKNQDEKLQQSWEFKKKIADAQKTISSIKERAISYNTRKASIMADTTLSPDQKKQKLAKLDEAANTDVHTPISAEDAFDEKIPDIAAGVSRTVEGVDILANINIQHKITVFTSSDLLRQSQMEATGLEAMFHGDNKDFFASSKNPFVIYHNAAESFNSALASPKYQKVNPTSNQVTIDYDEIKKDNPAIDNVLSLIDQYNNWATDMKTQASAGVFKDKAGKQYTSIQAIKPDDFFTIDKSKPLTGEQMIMLEKWRKSNPAIGVSVEVSNTGTALAEERNRIDLYQAKNTAWYQRQQVDLEKEKNKVQKALADKKGANQVQIDEAAQFANDILSRIRAASSKPDAKTGVVNVDWTKVQLSDIEKQMLGLGELSDNGKFTIKASEISDDDLTQADSRIKFDAASNRIVIGGETKSHWFSGDTKTADKYIDYKQIANNKYHFSSSVTAGKEGEERNSIATGYSGANGTGVPDKPDAQLTDAEYYTKYGKFRQK